MLPALPPPLTQSWSPFAPPRSIEPEPLLEIAPQLSEMLTYWPLRVVVTVPPGWKKTPPLLVKLFGAASPVSA